MVVIEHGLETLSEVIAQLRLTALPRFKFRQHLTHRGLHFRVETRVLGFGGKLLRHRLHALSEEGATRFFIHGAVCGLCGFHLAADLLHRLAHLLLALGRCEGSHEIATHLCHRCHDRFCFGLEGCLVINKKRFENHTLVFREIELPHEDRHIATLEVSLKRLADILHAATHAAAAAHHAATHSAEASTRCAPTTFTALTTAPLALAAICWGLILRVSDRCTEREHQGAYEHGSKSGCGHGTGGGLVLCHMGEPYGDAGERRPRVVAAREDEGRQIERPTSVAMALKTARFPEI